jgi:hypothetical protein
LIAARESLSSLSTGSFTLSVSESAVSDSEIEKELKKDASLGQFMFTCSSEISGYPFEGLAPSGELVCHIPEFPLTPGRYVFNLFSTIGGEVADWVQQAGYLNVVAGDYFGTGKLQTHDEGFVVKHRWTVKTMRV